MMLSRVGLGESIAAAGGWRKDFSSLWEHAGRCFRRRDTRSHAEGHVRALLGRVERKNAWRMAEYLGAGRPYPVRHFLGRANWSADALRDEVLRYSREHLTVSGDKGVLIVDETGFLKKGDKSVGVRRQCSGTAGRMENCQIGVFLALASSKGRALIDRGPYVPRSWCEDAVRRAEASIPGEVSFSTKQRLAQKMLSLAFDAGFSPDWVLADKVCGPDSKFRRFLEERGQAYVLAVSSQQRLWVGFSQKRVDAIGRELSPKERHRPSAVDGTEGQRLYDRAGGHFGTPAERGLTKWLLLRRSVEKSEDLSYCLCLAPADTSLKELARAAGQRRSIECCFGAAKQETGLDEYEVRSWHGRHRHIPFSMLALVFLSVVRGEASSRKKRVKALSR